MPISIYDFATGIDFTGLSGGIATAGDHNNLVNLATPVSDKGLVVVSQDSALNTPVVPDAFVSQTKWRTYIWVRRLYTGQSTVPLLYMWNDDATFVATYQKWQRVTADTSVIEALITALDTRIDALETAMTAAQNDIIAANNTAATALADSTTAKTNAATALTTANAAQTSANQGITDSAAALAKATTAETAANAATTAAGTATTAANAATVAVTDVTSVISPAANLALNTLITVTHAIPGFVPRRVRWILNCITNDTAAGFLQGDQIDVFSVFIETGSEVYTYPAFTCWANATTLNIRSANQPFKVNSDVAGVKAFRALTLANWKLQCIYSKY